MISISVHKKLSTASGIMDLTVETDIQKGSFVCLYGKSGVGKTSLLKILAGLMDVDHGVIKHDKHYWLDTAQKICIKPQKRNIGFVFQEYALFPNMSVRQNIAYGLPKNGKSVDIDILIDMVELGDLQHKKPTNLSGGQKQRVALARALAQKPDILLLDEPMAALDNEIRAKLQQYLLEIHKTFNITTVLVSHDISEILRLSDHMIVLSDGMVSYEGTPASFFGSKTLSGKFQFTGEIIAIEKQDIIFIVSVVVGKSLIKVVADEDEVSVLNIGDRVMVASKAFNPIIRKIS